MRRTIRQNGVACKWVSGFTLAEVLAALTIGSMVLVAALGVYISVEKGAANLTEKLDSMRLPAEVLQRIAEDLDGIISSSQDTKITITSKFDHGYSVVQMEILRTIKDDKGEEQVLEKIVWQSDVDLYVGDIVLYRSHSGLAMEDKLLDEQKELWERELFVPICAGITYFKIQVPGAGGELVDNWTSGLPRGVVVTISFAEPFKTPTGFLDVPEEEKTVRTIAIDRTRKINFKIPAVAAQQEPNEPGQQEPEEEQEQEEIVEEQQR